MSCLNRWRCKVCETLNDPNSSKCIVCDFGINVGREIGKPKPTRILKRCVFPECGSIAVENQKYCEYHLHTVCPCCNFRLKASNLDYCVECGLRLVEEQTSGLQKINKAFRIIDISMLIVFVVFLVSYFLL